jgi:protein SCO1/2
MQAKSNSFVWAGLGLISATVLVVTLDLKPLAHPAKPLPVYGPIADFTLTNQDGAAIALADLRGHVWIADIIFTRCAGPCLKMTRQMKELQQALTKDTQTRLVTLTTDPDYDSPSVLRTYAGRFGAELSRWIFLTGPKRQIASLAIDSLKLTAIEKKPQERDSPEDLFVHSTIFVLVDKQAQLRGVFETTGEGTDPQRVKEQILAAVRQLEKEG